MDKQTQDKSAAPLAAKGGVYALLAMGALMFVVIVIGSWLTINRLGQVYFAPMIPEETRAAYRLIVYFVATTTTGIPTLLTLVLTFQNNTLRNGAKAIMRIITMIWAIIVTILCLFSFAMDFGNDMLAGFESVLGIAPVIFAGIGGLNLIAVVSVILVSFTGSEEHSSVSGAVGGIMVWMSEFVLALAGFGFEAYYGLSIGIQALVASLAAMLMSGGFVMSLAKLHDARRRHDDFDKRVWGAVSVIFVAYIGVVGATAGAHLSGREDLIPTFILAIGERAFFFSQMLLAVVMWIAKIYTDNIDWIDGKRPERAPAVTVSRPPMTERLLGAAKTVQDFRDTLRAFGTRVPELPSGSGVPPSTPPHEGLPIVAGNDGSWRNAGIPASVSVPMNSEHPDSAGHIVDVDAENAGTPDPKSPGP